MSHRSKQLAIITALIGLSPLVQSQAAWQSVSPTASPVARRHFAVAYDSHRQVVVLFGGTKNGGARADLLNDTWEWNGLNWSQKLPANKPSARRWHAMAYDAARRRVVLFAGREFGDRKRDTWTWDGSNWTRLSPANRPDKLIGHAMAYDPLRQRVVLFAGEADNTTRQTWEWNGSNWQQRSPATIPARRRYHAMAWDGRYSRILMFGGYDESGYFSDTWAWDGTDWKKLSPGTVPAPRREHRMVYDSLRQRIVLHGGMRGATTLQDTFEWVEDNWVQRLSAPPPARAAFGFAFDAARSQAVRFGGYRASDDKVFAGTRVYGTTKAAAFVSYGTGCLGSAGVPKLTLGVHAWIGDTHKIGFETNRPASLGLLILGASDKQWGALTLPLHLEPLGANGCYLRASIDLAPLGVLTDSKGNATIALPVPNETSLVGSALYEQFLVFDPGWNLMNFVVSNAAKVTIGNP